MKSVLFLLSVISALSSFSCRGTREDIVELDEESILIYADKGVYLKLSAGSEILDDSLLYRNEIPVGLIISGENCESSMTAMLIPGCGSSPAERMDYLSSREVLNLDTNYVQPQGEIPGFTAVVYVIGDSSVVERVWNRGSGELAVLQVKARNTSLNILLSSIAGVLSTAEILEPINYHSRSVYLSDRTRSEIVEDVNADIAAPPIINHRISMSVDPLGREMHVLDSLTFDFRSTQSDSQLMIYLPDCDNGTSFEVRSGYYENFGDSVLCTADSTRIFTGVYSGNWHGFISSSTDSITEEGLYINPLTSFQSGMWFYPGCGIPSDYTFEVSVPDLEYEIYAPLIEVSRESRDSILTVSFISQMGGIKGPLSWAVGGFSESVIAGGSSRYICLESDSTAMGMIDLADNLADVFWRNMGYDGAMLDLVIVRSLDVPVFITGPGCVFLSTDILASIRGYEMWSDSLSSGIPVNATSIVFETAKAFLSGSTYLSESLRDVLAAWAVYRFACSGNESVSFQMLEAFRKYYLYSTEVSGGIEFAIADPLLYESPLYDPVILGKAPLVIEYLIHEIPAFERAIPRALGNLRHSGDCFNRLFSAMGIWESSYVEMFYMWLYSPGIPQLEISWKDSSGTLKLWVEQFQPGQDFPLGSILNDIRVITSTGFVDLNLLYGSTEGYFQGNVSSVTERILAVDINPDGMLPADIVYRHINSDPNDI